MMRRRNLIPQIVFSVSLVGLVAACGPSEEAQLQCVADYTVASRLQHKELAGQPRPANIFDGLMQQTDTVLLTGGPSTWTDCPKDFRAARDAAIDGRGDFLDAMNDMLGDDYDADALRELQSLTEAFQADIQTFTEIYTAYLDDPRVVTRIGTRLDGTAFEFLEGLQQR